MKNFPEVDRFENFCGTLCSNLRPRHREAAKSAEWAYRKAVEMYYLSQKAVLFERDQYQDQPACEEQKRWQGNWKTLRISYNKWKKEPIGRNRVGRGTGH